MKAAGMKRPRMKATTTIEAAATTAPSTPSTIAASALRVSWCEHEANCNRGDGCKKS